MVVDRHFVALDRRRSLAFFDHHVLQAAVGGHHAFLLGVLLEKRLAFGEVLLALGGAFLFLLGHHRLLLLHHALLQGGENFQSLFFREQRLAVTEGVGQPLGEDFGIDLEPLLLEVFAYRVADGVALLGLVGVEHDLLFGLTLTCHGQQGHQGDSEKCFFHCEITFLNRC